MGIPEWVDKDFFESNPRSAEVRGVCSRALEHLGALLHDESVAASLDLQGEHYAALEQLNGKLVELGICEDMNIDDWEDDKDWRDPARLSEWAAGQLIGCMGVNIPSRNAAMPSMREFSEGEGFGGKARLVGGTDHYPDIPREHVIYSEINNYLRELFDVS